jgi:hypothetical protein
MLSIQHRKADVRLMSTLLEEIQNIVSNGNNVNAPLHTPNMLGRVMSIYQGDSDVIRFSISCNVKIDKSNNHLMLDLVYNQYAYIFIDCGMIKPNDLFNGVPMLFVAALGSSSIVLFRHFMMMGSDQFITHSGISIIMYLFRHARTYIVNWRSLIKAGLIIPSEKIRTLGIEWQILALYALNL